MITRTRRFAVLGPPGVTLQPPDTAFATIFSDYPSDNVGIAARRGGDTSHGDLVYGEIPGVATVRRLIQAIQRHQGLSGHFSESFFDLGSGSGRPCIAAALCHSFKSCEGIEINPELFAISQQVARKWKELHPSHEAEIRFTLGSFLDPEHWDWVKGDLVFINSTCFSEQTMSKISEIASKMKTGAFSITLTYKLSLSAGFVVVEELRLPMSWCEFPLIVLNDDSIFRGEADFFIQQKQ